MARVPKMELVKISLARGIYCSTFFFFCPTSVPEEYVYIYTYLAVEIVYELPLLPSYAVNETFLHKSGAVRTVDRIFIIGAPALR